MGLLRLCEGLSSDRFTGPYLEMTSCPHIMFEQHANPNSLFVSGTKFEVRKANPPWSAAAYISSTIHCLLITWFRSTLAPLWENEMTKDLAFGDANNLIVMAEEHRHLRSVPEPSSVTGETLGLILFGCFCFIGLLAGGYRIRKRRWQQRQITLARQRARSSSMSDPLQQRKAHIEAYLVTKPALAHDALCDAASGRVEHSDSAMNPRLSWKRTAMDPAAATADGQSHVDEEELNCPGGGNPQAEGCSICFDNFEPSDLVSWSPNPCECQSSFFR